MATKRIIKPVPVSASISNKHGSQVDTITATLASRGSQYGKFDNHAEITQTLKRASADFVQRVHGKTIEQHLTPDQKEALDMIYHKIGRVLNGNPDLADSWHDMAGYATLVDKRLCGQTL